MNLGKNIRKLRKAKKMTILELANAVDTDTSNISRIESGKREHHSLDMLSRIAAVLGVGLPDLLAPEVGVDEIIIRDRVPLISWVAAGNCCKAVSKYSLEDVEEWLICPVRHGERTYALRVKGDSMFNPNGKPSFRDGEFIFIDPDRDPLHKSLIIAHLNDENTVAFKRLLIMLDGDKILETLNPEWPDRIFHVNNNATICGVVIARMESFE